MPDLFSGLPADWMNIFDPNVSGEGTVNPLRVSRTLHRLVGDPMFLQLTWSFCRESCEFHLSARISYQGLPKMADQQPQMERKR